MFLLFMRKSITTLLSKPLILRCSSSDGLLANLIHFLDFAPTTTVRSQGAPVEMDCGCHHRDRVNNLECYACLSIE